MYWAAIFQPSVTDLTLNMLIVFYITKDINQKANGISDKYQNSYISRN